MMHVEPSVEILLQWRLDVAGICVEGESTIQAECFRTHYSSLACMTICESFVRIIFDLVSLNYERTCKSFFSRMHP